jgi:hypothetical protein
VGKSIRIYLPNDNVSGIRHGEIANWSGQALACPRSRFQELRDWPEVQRPGVYFLFGVDDETGEDAAYIGEAEVVIDRLSSHLSGKNFWAELVAFTSKDENLTKAHVRYLESRLVSMAREAARYRIVNAAIPQLPSLPRADRDAMDDFLESTRTLLGVLGHKVLELLVLKPVPAKKIADDPVTRLIAHIPVPGSAKVLESSPVFHLHVSGLNARAVRTDEGIVVFEGSEAVADASKSLTGGQLALRQSLIDSGALVPSVGKLRLIHDHLFKSPSQAGAVMAGYSINGREFWRLDDGTTYSKYEASLPLA